MRFGAPRRRTEITVERVGVAFAERENEANVRLGIRVEPIRAIAAACCASGDDESTADEANAGFTERN